MLSAVYSRKEGPRSTKVLICLIPLFFSFWFLTSIVCFWQKKHRFSLLRLPNTFQCKTLCLIYFNSAKLGLKRGLKSSMISVSSEQNFLEAVPQKIRFFFKVWLEKSMLLYLLNYSYLFHWKFLVPQMYLDLAEEIGCLGVLEGVSDDLVKIWLHMTEL